MISHILFRKCTLSFDNITFIRYLRGMALRNEVPKRIEGKVKTATQYNENENSVLEREGLSYKDFIKHAEKTNLTNELDLEKEFLNEDCFGHITERCDMYYDMHLSEEQRRKSEIKKKIIGQKYFKLDKETNLLTHAAKQQIRFLHKSNPLEWNYKALSQCFPISEEGVKKLLKCNFELTCPEKIKLHDEDVARKWKILKSGEPTDEIYPLTQKLYKEGKLVDDYFSGNPNLPTVPPVQKNVIEVKKTEKLGEYSAIIKTYLDYQKQKILESSKKDLNEKQITLRNPITPETNNINMKKLKKLKFENDDNDDYVPQVYPIQIKKRMNNDEIPFSQFKEVLREETSMKKAKHKNEYDDFVMKETSKQENIIKKSQNNQNYFLKISKYNKENINLMYEQNKSAKTVYMYDEKLGYQYPTGKTIKGKLNVFPRQSNKKIVKDGHYVYDKNGEFLYRIP